jgi:glycosyltransferase involved in cell wall biosynthesis
MSYRNLIFLHIPKAAGTTLHSILEGHYPPSSCYSIYDPDEAAKEFVQWPRERREPIRLLKGHVAFGLHESLIGETTYITLLRDPVDRIMSHYYYAKRMPSHYLYNKITERTMSLQDYASAGLTDELDNGQVRLLAGIASDKSVPIGACDTNLLNLAKSHIERHFCVAGLSERFDESLALMAIQLGWDWTPSYESLNVTPERPGKGQVDPAARAAIERANPLDCELYAWAKHRFEALLDQHRDEVTRLVGRIQGTQRKPVPRVTDPSARNSMKVLFVGNPSERPTDGGSATFQQAVLGGLQRMSSAHECSYVQPTPGKGVVQAWVVEKKIDFVWFLSPYYEPVEVPFASTVWDLAHREMPYFPEFSLSGWKFDEREGFYSHVLPRASLVVIGNGVGARSVSEFYRVRPENICEIPLPVDVNALKVPTRDASALQPYGLKPSEYLFYPAQFWPHKNHITLVDALAILRKSGSPMKLVFSGGDKGNRKHVEEYVARSGLQDSVVFAGFVETPVLHQLYLNAYAMTFASLLGPDNLPPLEAMALGCPVISAAFNGARAQMGDAALFFDGLDASDAVTQILALADSKLKERLIDNGHSLVQTRSPDVYVAKINQALDHFAKKRRLWGPSNSYRHT